MTHGLSAGLFLRNFCGKLNKSLKNKKIRIGAKIYNRWNWTMTWYNWLIVLLWHKESDSLHWLYSGVPCVELPWEIAPNSVVRGLRTFPARPKGIPTGDLGKGHCVRIERTQCLRTGIEVDSLEWKEREDRPARFPPDRVQVMAKFAWLIFVE